MKSKINKVTNIKLTDICDIIMNPNEMGKLRKPAIIILSDLSIYYNTTHNMELPILYLLRNKSRQSPKLKDSHFKYIYYYLNIHKNLLLKNITSYIIPIPTDDYIEMIINTLDTVYEQIQSNNLSISTYDKIKRNIIISLTLNKCKLKKLGDICEIIKNEENTDFIYYKSRIKRIIDKYLYYYIVTNPYYNADKFAQDIMIKIPLKRVQKEIIKECEYWDDMITKLNKQNEKLINYYFN